MGAGKEPLEVFYGLHGFLPEFDLVLGPLGGRWEVEEITQSLVHVLLEVLGLGFEVT